MEKHGKQPGQSSGDNTVERAYAYLRDRTISFGFRPGERMNEVELAAILGMSRAPVREALNRLIVDGLVAFEPRRGFFCRKLSATEITELFGVRADLELSAVRQACAVASQSDIEIQQARWTDVETHKPGMAIDTLVEADEAFHLGIAALAGNAERLKYLRNINARIRFVRRINLEDPARRSASLGEHSLILDAISRRDADGAVALMQHHLSFSSEEVKSRIHEGLARIYAEEVA
ncbi:GntR family transcriptional regulator [Rhizobium herbae]|uniref:DNA-binding GntR family transcriptional regulator n=1 Tax=Rhizobium herbae TaxID=508661 RepID=A0ABS4EV56_9HYPH|nr:GntR family transcriptional regulator [Rhizobium herbae]MBP1861798.1 DNA-binding GntR family transcriptional regulator [Rhizobium herbae]